MCCMITHYVVAAMFFRDFWLLVIGIDQVYKTCQYNVYQEKSVMYSDSFPNGFKNINLRKGFHFFSVFQDLVG